MLMGPARMPALPARLLIHKDSFSLLPGVQRVGLRKPQAHILKPQALPRPRGGGLQSQCLELFSLVLSFSSSLYVVPNPSRGHPVQGHAGSD